MKLKNVDAYQSFIIMQESSEIGMLGFAIAKNMRKLANELIEYDNKRNELIKKYGTQTDGDKYQFTIEDSKRFYEEMKPFDELEIEFEPMTVTEETFAGGSLTSDQMYPLMWMVKED